MTSQFVIYYEGKGTVFPNHIDNDYFNITMKDAIEKAQDKLDENSMVMGAKIVHNLNHMRRYLQITKKDTVLDFTWHPISELER